MTNISILGTRPRGFLRSIFSKLIRLMQRLEYSHMVVMFDDVVYDASVGGVRFSYAQDFLKDNIVVKEWNTNIDSCEYNIHMWFNRLLGTRYGFLQVFGIFLQLLRLTKNNLFSNGKRGMVCNELVLRFLKRYKELPIHRIDSFDLVATEKLLNTLVVNGKHRQ